MIYLHWHTWQSNNNWLLSDENNKQLKQFKTFDDMINYLMLSGNRDAAKHFNKLNKGL